MNVSLNKSCVIGGSKSRVLAIVVVVTVLLSESLNSVFSSLNWWCNWLLSTSGNAANASCTSSSLPAKSTRAALFSGSDKSSRATIEGPPPCRVYSKWGGQTAMLSPDSWQMGGNCPPCPPPVPRACSSCMVSTTRGRTKVNCQLAEACLD